MKVVITLLAFLALTGTASAESYAFRYNHVRHVLVVPHSSVKNFHCIYGYENAGYGWKAHTGNGYYGGLQMDLGFQGTYGKWYLNHWGTADHWAPFVQIYVAYRASRTRGYHPWPNTARYCHLI